VKPEAVETDGQSAITPIGECENGFKHNVGMPDQLHEVFAVRPVLPFKPISNCALVRECNSRHGLHCGWTAPVPAYSHSIFSASSTIRLIVRIVDAREKIRCKIFTLSARALRGSEQTSCAESQRPTMMICRMDLRTASRKAWLAFSIKCQRSATRSKTGVGTEGRRRQCFHFAPPTALAFREKPRERQHDLIGRCRNLRC
jgi:hypothetical protein